MIEKIEQYAKENDVPIIEKDGRDFLIDYIDNNNCLNILEIGSAIGYSAIIMASRTCCNHVDTIERNEKYYQLALENIKECCLNEKITIFNEDALEFDISKLDKRYDLIFIDAAKAQYQKFFEKYQVLLADEGAIIIDNIDFHGFVTGTRETNNRNTRQLVNKIKKFVEWIKIQPNYSVDYYQVGDGIFVVKRKM